VWTRRKTYGEEGMEGA